MPDERHPEYLPRQLVALEIDQVEVAGHASCDYVSEVIDQFVVTEFQSHDHGDPDHLRLNLRIQVALDQWTKRVGTGVGITTPPGGLGLGEQKVGVKPQGGILVGGFCKYGASRQEGFAVGRGIVQLDQRLLAAEEDAQDFVPIRGGRMLLNQRFGFPDDAGWRVSFSMTTPPCRLRPAWLQERRLHPRERGPHCSDRLQAGL